MKSLTSSQFQVWQVQVSKKFQNSKLTCQSKKNRRFLFVKPFIFYRHFHSHSGMLKALWNAWKWNFCVNLFTMTFQSDLLLWDLHREAIHSFPINPCKGQPWQMEYSHQNIFLLLFTTPTSPFPQGQCSLFMLHYIIHFDGTIVASKPIKPLWLVNGFQRIIGHDWPLPFILHLQF